MNSIQILGTQIDAMNVSELLKKIQTSAEPIWIVTANPEILLYAKDDKDYRKTLSKASLRLIDSFGLQMVCKLKGMDAQRIPGADLAFKIVRGAVEHHQAIAMIGGGDKRSAKPALHRLTTYHPTLRGLAEDGGMISIKGEGDSENQRARGRIAEFKPSVLLVGFGHPKQERWIERYKHEFPSVKVFIGVGGTFDYWSGLIQRAPKWMRTLGIEWLYRLIKEPKRWKRILRAVFVFPFFSIFDKNNF